MNKKKLNKIVMEFQTATKKFIITNLRVANLGSGMSKIARQKTFQKYRKM